MELTINWGKHKLIIKKKTLFYKKSYKTKLINKIDYR